MRTSTLFASLAIPIAVLADPHAPNHARHHHDIARRASGDVQLHKRYDAARFTYYQVGMGACGKVNKPSDFIVALNSPQYGGGYPGPHCFQQITIHCRGKTTSATIMDECPGCPFGGLDFSEGLFEFCGPKSLGVITGSWEFGGGGGGGGGDEKPQPKHDPPKEHSSSQKPPPKTTTTHSAEKKKPTSTSTKSSSSSLKHTTSSHKSVTTTTSLNLKGGSASGLAVPSGTIKSTPGDPQSINGINQAVIGLGAMVVSEAKLA